MASKVEVEVEMKSKADKVWENIRESATVFPKALSNHFESIEVLEGDGKSVGSVRLVKYQPQPGISAEITKPAKEKLEKVDEVNKSMIYSASEDIPNPDFLRDFAVKSFHDLDAYIFGNP
ncbi:hypothetical protein DH2020_027006 [Rehmannia glutinosa]|uniref:Bet v I/Major latex protein domain-containing protein n=1 Tax=Rehmannia glutinosa TaxID=99300 RepID=A0ABR0VVA6_REHGL